MQTPDNEIILLNLPADCNAPRPCYNRFPGRPAPLGLFCLATAAPQKISVIEAQNSTAMVDALTGLTGVRALIFQTSEKAEPEKLQQFSARIRATLPGVMLGINTENPELPAGFDFAVKGTGKAIVLRILRGDRPSGFIDCSCEDAASPLAVPEEPFVDCGYEILPEKWLYASTLEIAQPWLGLQDRSATRRTWPGLDWVAGLIAWLKQSGFAAFHFCPSGLTADDLHELRSLMLNQKARFAVSFNAGDVINIRQIGWPLLQVWLYQTGEASLTAMQHHLQHIHEAGFQVGLQIDHAWAAIDGSASLLGQIDRLAFSDESCWPFSELRKVTARYWSGKNRFIRRLFSVRSASELVMFMKTTYTILETIFSSDEKGR